MLWRHNAIDLEAALRAAAPAPPFPAISDRAAWSRVRERLPDACDQIVAAAEAAARTAVPPLPATLFLEFDRRGDDGARAGRVRAPGRRATRPGAVEADPRRGRPPLPGAVPEPPRPLVAARLRATAGQQLDGRLRRRGRRRSDLPRGRPGSA